MSKPGKVLRNLCKRLKVRLTTKRNGKRVYKSVKVLKEQCKKKKKVKKKKVKRKFGATIIEEEEHLEETVILAKKSGLSTGQIISIILGVLAGAGLITGLGYYIGNQSKNKFGSSSTPSTPNTPVQYRNDDEDNNYNNPVYTIPRGPPLPPMPLQQPGQQEQLTQSVVRDLLPQLNQAAQLNQELDIDINNEGIRISTDDGHFMNYNLQGNTGLVTQYINNRGHVLALFNTYPGLGQVFIGWLHNFLTNTLLDNHIRLVSNDEYFTNNPGLEEFFYHWINIQN